MKQDDANPTESKSHKLHLKIYQFVVCYSEATSLHGLTYVLKGGLHITERLLWIICIGIAIFGTVSLSQRTWNRYQTSPMVISMDRNKFFWNTSFPGITVCSHKRIDDDKLENYISAHPEKFPTERTKLNFKEFIIKLANITYENLEELPMNNTFNIDGKDYLDLMWNLSWTFDPKVSSGTANQFFMQDVVTELGICYAVNANIAIYNSYNYWKYNRWDTVGVNGTVAVHPLDGEIYAQLINLSYSYEVYFHSAMDLPDISRRRYSFEYGDYTTVELQALEIITTENARTLSVSQRQCRFPHESQILTSSPIYTYSLCRIECRMKLTMQFCNCIPHFYRAKGKNGQKFPVCDLEGLRCIVAIKDELISLKSNVIKINCDCLANCDDTNFFVQSYRSRVWFLGTNLQWGINDYPKMQLRRDLIFGFTDLLVYVGGTAGFMLGCSILSITEILYFASIKLMFEFKKNEINI